MTHGNGRTNSTLIVIMCVGIAALALVLGIGAGVFVLSERVTKEENGTATTEQDGGGTAEADEADSGGDGADSDTTGAGDTSVQPGALEYSVASVETGVGAIEGARQTVEPEGQHIVFQLDLRNNGDEESWHTGSEVTLVDSDGVEHEFSIPAGPAVSETGVTSSRLQPGEQDTRPIVFDIPEHVEPEYLRVGDGEDGGRIDELYF
ncbi:DUF4352 domain-containing protein [Nocardiopsis sp. HNM0947]|uniref:DUF4352 domain-containing protein n=1 Tax=Nocardiopsis coralli TaxID=2772213 RepID=A0ABR9P1G0_9ACTN|nr:DUF4352 domain-containing protein [Nocardiopsis coralli]MBE2997670.1 DUF4352 domain-containing protein [Nocardiopsis coralli]